MEKDLVFRVALQDGREYRCYTDGTIEGFPEGAMVFNYWPALLALELSRASAAPACPTSNVTSSK